MLPLVWVPLVSDLSCYPFFGPLVESYIVYGNNHSTFTNSLCNSPVTGSEPPSPFRLLSILEVFNRFNTGFLSYPYSVHFPCPHPTPSYPVYRFRLLFWPSLNVQLQGVSSSSTKFTPSRPIFPSAPPLMTTLYSDLSKSPSQVSIRRLGAIPQSSR